MLTSTDPREAYRRIAFDARVHGSDAASLVDLCLEQAIDHLGLALSADERGQTALRSQSITKVMTAITALEMGVDSSASLAQPLYHFYRSARQTLLRNVIFVESTALRTLRSDLADLRKAFSQSATVG